MSIAETVVKWLIPFLCGSAVSAFATWITARKKRRTALENGVCALLRAEIIRASSRYAAEGACPVYAKEALTRTYQAYHALGGNDVATRLYDETMALPEAANG